LVDYGQSKLVAGVLVATLFNSQITIRKTNAHNCYHYFV